MNHFTAQKENMSVGPTEIASVCGGGSAWMKRAGVVWRERGERGEREGREEHGLTVCVG